MVPIFAGEERHIACIKNLTDVLTSSTLAIFQQGEKQLQTFLCFSTQALFTRHIYVTGLRDHPDIAESFMYLHAQVGAVTVTLGGLRVSISRHLFTVLFLDS